MNNNIRDAKGAYDYALALTKEIIGSLENVLPVGYEMISEGSNCIKVTIRRDAFYGPPLFDIRIVYGLNPRKRVVAYRATRYLNKDLLKKLKKILSEKEFKILYNY